MQNFKNKARAVYKIVSGRAFAVSALSVAMAGTLYGMASMVNTITIYDEVKTVQMHTFKTDPQDILKQNGIITLSADVVNFTGIAGGYGEIDIDRAFPIQIKADGLTRTRQVIGGTVGSILAQEGITYDSDDLITPTPEKILEENESILVQRIDYVTRSEELEIPHETEIRSTPLLPNGRSMTLQAGRNGQKTLSYMQRTVDGIVEQEELVSESIDQSPIKEIVLQGGNTPVSPLDFGVPMDENGVPLEYREVLTNQVATGYNAGSGAWGASGERLSAGYVAVHPEKIPYGTRMYIASEDGSFVYGYAVAADTGLGLLDDIIDVDLYYDTYTESCLNGRKTVNIYILD